MPYTTEQEQALLRLLSEDKQRRQASEAFDITTARPVDEGFDLSTARPVDQAAQSSFGDLRIAPFGPPLKEYPLIAANAFNAAGAGIPGALYHRLTGQSIPQPQSLPGRFLNVVGEGAGLMTGVPGAAGRVAVAAMPATIAKTVLGRAAMRAAEGATIGAAANLTDVQHAPLRAGIGATANVAIPPAVNSATTLAGDIYRVTNTPLRARFVDSIRNAFLQSKKLAGETFGNKIDALSTKFPDKTIDVSDIVNEVQQRSLNNPAFKAIVMRGVRNDQESILMQSILNQPETAQQLTLKDAQALKQVFSRVLKQKFNQVSPDYTDAHLDALDIWHGIRAAQLEAFPEFADIAAGYRKAITDFRTVKPYLSKAALEPNLLSNFGNKAEIMQSVRELLPKETLKEIERYVRAYHVMRGATTLGKAAAIGAAGTGAGGLVLKSILGEKR